MFTLSIECSKDITELHINFADGTSSTIGNESNGDQEKKAVNATNVIVHEQESTVRHAHSQPSVKNRKSLDSYVRDELDFEDAAKTTTFETVTPPTIEKIERDVLVSDEIKNGKY